MLTREVSARRVSSLTKCVKGLMSVVVPLMLARQCSSDFVDGYTKVIIIT